MIVKNNTDAKVERRKAWLNLTGDVYIVDDVYMESLESHKKLIPNSTAETIEQAERERIQYQAEQAELLRKVQEQNSHSGEGLEESISEG